MTHPRINGLLIFWLAAFIFMASRAASQDVVYKRLLPTRQTLVITRREATDVPLDNPMPPGFTYAKTDHIYDYDFVLLSSSLQSHPIKLWTHTLYSYSPIGNLPSLPNEFEVLDVTVQEKTLIVVYKEFNKTWGGWTFANMVTKTTGRNEWQAMSYNDSKLIHDSDSDQVYITAATITGTVKKKTLSVSLKKVHSTLLYHWVEGKWAADHKQQK